mgnify:CR=1 FL=1
MITLDKGFQVPLTQVPGNKDLISSMKCSCAAYPCDGVVGCSKKPREWAAMWGEKEGKTVQKNGEETLATKSPYLIMRGLGPIIIHKKLLGHVGMFTHDQWPKSYKKQCKCL